MCKYRDSAVRRAVARHIMQQVRHSRVAKQQRRTYSAFSASSAASVSGCVSEPELRPRPATAAVTMTTAAISALAAAMSVTRMDGECTDEPSLAPVVLDAETLLIERIVELQREKEYLLRIVQRTSS